MTDSRAAMSDYPRCGSCEHWTPPEGEGFDHEIGDCDRLTGFVRAYGVNLQPKIHEGPGRKVQTQKTFGCIHHADLTTPNHQPEE